jgi:elongation factor P
MRVTDARKGMIVVHEGQLHIIVDYEHIAPGNWRAINQLKLKNLKTNSNVMLRLGSSEQLEQAFLDLKPATYLYFDRNSGFVFMDSESFEQHTLTEELVGDKKGYLIENAEVTLTFHEAQPVGIQLPAAVTLRVTEAEPAARGNTVNAVTKKVKLETGIEVRVPGYIEMGELVKVSTETGEFQGRVKE